MTPSTPYSSGARKPVHVWVLKSELDSLKAVADAAWSRVVSPGLPVGEGDLGSSSPKSEDTHRAPDGWVLVPIEPTPEMVGAFWRQKNTGSQEPGETGDDRSDYAAYRAMIAARPTGASQ